VVLLAGCAAKPAAGPAGAALWLGGDVHLGARGFEVLAALPDLTHGEPLAVNLEGPIGDGAEDSSAQRLVNGRQAPAALARAGVRVAGVENNHDDDLGSGGRAATKKALVAAGLLPAGAPPALGSFGPAVLQVGGRPVQVFAVDLRAGVPAGLAQALRDARRPGDTLVVMFHVTGPPSVLPADELEAGVKAALEAGATVIVAQGTHVPARVERRGGAVIAWGLGNLAFDCECTGEGDGLLLRVAFAADGSVSRATVVPVDAGLHGAALRPAKDAAVALDELEGLGSSPLRRSADSADF